MSYQEAVLRKQSFMESIGIFMTRMDVIEDLELERIIARLMDNHVDDQTTVKIFLLRGLLKDRVEGVKRQAIIKRKMTIRRRQIDMFMRDVAKIEHNKMTQIHQRRVAKTTEKHKTDCSKKRAEHHEMVTTAEKEYVIELEIWKQEFSIWKAQPFIDRYFRSSRPERPGVKEIPLILPTLQPVIGLINLHSYTANRIAETTPEDYLYYYIFYFNIKHYELALELFELTFS